MQKDDFNHSSNNQDQYAIEKIYTSTDGLKLCQIQSALFITYRQYSTPLQNKPSNTTLLCTYLYIDV